MVYTDQRLELVRDQFIQGVQSSSTQLRLMKEMPKTVEEAACYSRDAVGSYKGGAEEAVQTAHTGVAGGRKGYETGGRRGLRGVVSDGGEAEKAGGRL